jgi:hypothetical protein
MVNDSTGRFQGVLSRPAGCGRSAQNAIKILFRRNEPKILLKLKELAVLGPKNELVLESQKPRSNPRIWPKIHALWGSEAIGRNQKQILRCAPAAAGHVILIPPCGRRVCFSAPGDEVGAWCCVEGNEKMETGN